MVKIICLKQKVDIVYTWEAKFSITFRCSTTMFRHKSNNLAQHCLFCCLFVCLLFVCLCTCLFTCLFVCVLVFLLVCFDVLSYIHSLVPRLRFCKWAWERGCELVLPNECPFAETEC